MRNRIVDYLTVEIMADKSFKVHYAVRVRAAWALAEEKYEKLTEEEKKEIVKKINEHGG
tara:strand:+ start:113 stop:289 length:177 start_codon:yes stop_codon:yes gene_type:complete